MGKWPVCIQKRSFELNLEDYIKSPWNSTHDIYKNSFLHMRPAPEYATGEVLLASTYRSVGFSKDTVKESNVPTLGREFQKTIEKGKRNKSEYESDLDPDTWKRIITGTLRSPKQPNQTSKRFLQLSPVVPDASIYSLSARLSSNSWNPGALVSRVLEFGEPKDIDVNENWQQLFSALSVGENDDIWARFLQEEFKTWRAKGMQNAWSPPDRIKRDEVISAWHKSSVPIPAERFTADFLQVLSLKTLLTRRQWVSMLESVLRLGSASHILWICRANAVCFDLMRQALSGEHVGGVDQVEERLGMKQGFWRYGQHAATTIAEAATSFAKARVGINLLLCQLEETFGNKLPKDALSNIDSIANLIAWLSQKDVRNKFDHESFRGHYQDVIEFDPRIVAGKKGISSNVKEFLRHVLGQRQTAEAGLDSYDQGYYLAKKGVARNSPWLVSLGPVSVLFLVHACTHKTSGPRTINNLCEHLSEYGIEIDAQEVADSALGTTLRSLGLVLDSPDAEGGMVLINPFDLMDKKAAE